MQELNSKVYETISGDTWDCISHKVYGTIEMTEQLRNANKEFIRIIIFSSGVLLICPEIEAKTTGGLPPWVE
ncbi:tail protein X [uncultured Clostridium sp.]|uniref:tail protein X n=1 Tax=uncultured Clostridium sp. TaxID=59620 RepID=UPI002606A07D|nr:tail protein X [uncultured Clostridium sp.]